MLKFFTRRKKTGQNGYTLVLVLVLLGMGSILIAGLLGFMGAGAKSGKVFHDKTKELYAADAGIQEAVWLVKTGKVANLVSPSQYSAYDYNTVWPDPNMDQVNTKSVAVTVQNEWMPSNFDISGISETTLRNIIEDAKLVVTGSTVENGLISKYKIKITYYPLASETMLVNSIGVWLPPGCSFYSDSTHRSSFETYSGDYYSEPVSTLHKGGEATVWTFSSPPVFDEDFPNADGTLPVEMDAYFYFKPPESQPNLKPTAVSWIIPGGVTDVPVSWDADNMIFRLFSTAGDTTVESNIGKSETRQMATAIGGDYVAIGNSLMVDYSPSDHERDDLLTESNATVDDIPESAEVELAYLYWSGWFSNATAEIPPGQSHFNDFDNWTVAGVPSGNEQRVPISDADITGFWITSALTTITRVPVSDGDVSGTWNTAPRWDDVDENNSIIPIDDSNFMTGTTDSGGYMLFNITPFNVPAGATNISLILHIRANDVSNGTNNIRERIKVNGTYYNGSSNRNPGTSFTDYSYTWATNPSTGAAWTVADINGTGSNALQQIGVNSTDLNPDMRVSMVYAEVSYNDPTSAKYPTVDETTANDSDYLTGTTDAGSYMLFNIAPFDVPAGATNISLTIYIRARDALSGTNNIYERLKVDGNYYNGTSSHNPGTTFTDYSYTWATNPAGGAWTVADINGTGSNPLQQIGVYSTDLNPDMLVSMVFAEVTWQGSTAWTYSGQFIGQGSPSATTDAKTISLANNVNLGGRPVGSVMINWTQSRGGTWESDDKLYYAISNDGGVSWGPNIDANAASANFSIIVPENYLTASFKIRLFADLDATSEYAYVDNINIVSLPFDDTAFFEIDGTRVDFNGGVPRDVGAGVLTADPTDIQVMADESEGGPSPTGYFYACRKDVTELIRAFSEKAPDPAINHPGNGEYTVGGVNANVGDQKSYAGWSLVIVYSSSSTQGHQLYLFDTMKMSIDDEHMYYDISGFIVPPRIVDAVTSINLTSQGSGYTSTPTIQFNGGGGDNAAAMATISGGRVTQITILNGGSGYTSAPTITIIGGGGNGANATTVVGSETYVGKVTCFVGEGDDWLSPETFRVNTSQLHDGTGETNNVWNGQSVGMSAQGVDVDTFNVQWGTLNQGDTSALIDINTGEDTWQLIYIIISFRSSTTTGGSLSYLIH